MARRRCASGSGGRYWRLEIRVRSIASHHCPWADRRRHGNSSDRCRTPWRVPGRPPEAPRTGCASSILPLHLGSNQTRLSSTVSQTEAGNLKEQGRSARKRRAILDAATEVFLQKGYLATNMDEIAALAAVSKQTVYKNFPGKETLFVEIVSAVSNQASDRVHSEMPDLAEGEDIAEYLRRYAYRQLTIVLTPRVMKLRRLVIGEVGRFPELARALFDGGPRRAMAAMAVLFERLA